jgi:hypothetical protein
MGGKPMPMRCCRPQRFMPQGVGWTRAQLEALPGLCLHDLMLLPISACAASSTAALPAGPAEGEPRR